MVLELSVNGLSQINVRDDELVMKFPPILGQRT